MKLGTGKAAGHDKIVNEMIKYMGKREEDMLLKILKMVWKEKRIIKDGRQQGV